MSSALRRRRAARARRRATAAANRSRRSTERRSATAITSRTRRSATLDVAPDAALERPQDARRVAAGRPRRREPAGVDLRRSCRRRRAPRRPSVAYDAASGTRAGDTSAARGVGRRRCRARSTWRRPARRTETKSPRASPARSSRRWRRGELPRRSRRRRRRARSLARCFHDRRRVHTTCSRVRRAAPSATSACHSRMSTPRGPTVARRRVVGAACYGSAIELVGLGQRLDRVLGVVERRLGDDDLRAARRSALSARTGCRPT